MLIVENFQYLSKKTLSPMVIYLLGGMRLPICLGESRMGNKVINLVSREGSHQSF